MDDGEIPVKGFDIVGDFIVAISVENFGKVSLENQSSLVNVEVELKSVEVASRDNQFNLPIPESLIVVLLS